MFSRITSTLAALAVALWLGGMIFLFVGVQVLFGAFPKASSDVAVRAAPALFGAFETYQLVLAAAALVTTFLWYFVSRSKRVMAVFVLLALAAAGAALSSTLITSRMQRLRAAGQSGSPQFMRLHGRSMMVYTSQAALLLAASLILPGALVSTTAASASKRDEKVE